MQLHQPTLRSQPDGDNSRQNMPYISARQTSTGGLHDTHDTGYDFNDALLPIGASRAIGCSSLSPTSAALRIEAAAAIT